MYGLDNTKDLSLFDMVQGMFGDAFAKEMKTNIAETDDAYLLEVEVPGINKENISISYENDYLTVEVKKSEDSNKTTYLKKERVSMDMSRSFYLEEVDESNIKARMENGILFIEAKKLPKVEPEKKVITID